MRFISSKSKNQRRHGQGSRIQSQLNLPNQIRRRVKEADNTSKQVGLSGPTCFYTAKRFITQGISGPEDSQKPGRRPCYSPQKALYVVFNGVITRSKCASIQWA